MSVTPSSRLDAAAWQIVERLPSDDDPNQDLLFELANGEPIEMLARMYASGNVATLRNRIRVQCTRLGIPLEYTTPDGIEVLKRAFELFNQNAPRTK